MFTSLDVAGSPVISTPTKSPNHAANKRSKFWLVVNEWLRPPGRRLIFHLICRRLPLLILWTIIVMLILYKLLGSSNSIPEKSVEKLSEFLQPKTTTHKQSSARHVRESKVFILIIQNEDLRTMNSVSIGTKKLRFVVPPHIRLLISILESHRIDYTVDTTRTGLPTTLLVDSENKQYSVIVIDDFVKYTRLSRWIRDQLDRHCRANQIGVITYLTASHLDDQRLGSGYSVLTRRILTRHNRAPTSTISVTAENELLADQFPITFKPMEQQSCKNQSHPTCLIDYQLNERSPVLRVLKRRPDFIIPGPLSVDDSTWVSMLSNHITYEPLTWAKLRKNTQKIDHISPVVEIQMRPDERLAKLRPWHGKANEDQIENYNTTHEYHDSQFQAAPKVELSPASTKESEGLSEVHDMSSLSSSSHPQLNDDVERQILSMFDRGLYDGIKRVIFGGTNHHWLNRVLLLDAIEHLSSGQILSTLERYIQIDIDDIFVGEKGKRMNSDDVDALIEVQQKLANRIDGGFKFNLGFSGKYFKHGYESENLGDEKLISKAHEFTWFCHTWSHSKAHLSNNSATIKSELRKNFDFAKEHNLTLVGHHQNSVHEFKDTSSDGTNIPPTYAIAPHHSGVYPIHEQLYEAWREILNVQVTSTEEYPHLRPANGRRAFVHKAIKVLPRQTCGLYTHTVYKRKYPGGFEQLEASIEGGELFETILHNPVNIYMTHMSNYALDRLAPYTFSALIDFVQFNTNLQLRFANQFGPMKLANYYFDLYPEERQPLWTNPCNDKRHLAIWSTNKADQYCPIVPKLLIVGPQKTGTTALYTFLKMNPIFKSSKMSSTDFEEIQFFNDKHYFEGIDWYFERFRPQESKESDSRSSQVTNSSSEASDNNRLKYEDKQPALSPLMDREEFYYFDKSATYFDDPKVAKRASYLLPDARIVILLVNPADRAYSWYQHIRAHGDPVANSMSFEQVITSKDEDPSFSVGLRSLRQRCLHPGYYSQHLSRWLDYYPSRQIIIIDGEWFKHNPASVMNRLQLLFRIEEPLDYKNLLIYSEQKGFFCEKRAFHYKDHTREGQFETKCLGSSKGRKYKPMSPEAREFLNRHYWAHNRQLARLLSDIGQPLPSWLEETVSVGHVSSAIY